MYCRMCGGKLDSTDRFCKICGTKIDSKSPAESPESIERKEETVEAVEEVVFNPPHSEDSHHNRFYLVEDQTSETKEEQENLNDQTSLDSELGKEDLKDQTPGAEVEKEGLKEFNWNVHDFSKNKKTEEAVFNWNLEDYGKADKKEAAAAFLEEELFREMRDESNRIKESNIDRFFTFSRKNEEFQKLLDKEYEKFNRFTSIDADFESEEAPSIPSSKETDSEMARARTEFFGESLIKDNESIIRKLEFSEQEILPDDTADTPAEEPDDTADTPIEEPDETADTPIEEPDNTADTPAEEPDNPAEEPDDPEAEPVNPAEEFGNPDEGPDSGNLVAKPGTLIEEPAKADYEPAFGIGWAAIEEENRSSRKKHRAGQIVLIIIAIILAFEIAILAIRYFAPDSGASRWINETQTQIINTITGWFDGINGNNSGNASNQDNDKQGGQNPDGQDEKDGRPDGQTQDNGGAPTPDPVPMADKAALVATQMYRNTNIGTVQAANALVYEAAKDYGIADLNNSKPIANNIWTEKDGQTVYYDQSIVGTIIAFDSQWIDYVNNGNNSVLSLLKKDSPAYKNAAGFSKIGKIKETFKLLEIGEIRQGSDGFYVWVHEEIEITEKGVTTAKKYNWIYYLEPVDGNLNIVNYFKFK